MKQSAQGSQPEGPAMCFANLWTISHRAKGGSREKVSATAWYPSTDVYFYSPYPGTGGRPDLLARNFLFMVP